MAAKRGKQAVRSGNGGWPAWVWLCLGVLLGLVLSAVVLVKDWAPALRRHDGPAPNPEASAPRASEPGVADQAQQAEAAKKKPTYDFYSVLPEKEVVIPDAEISAKARAEAQARQQQPAGATPTAATAGYLLQVGSFPNAADADGMKAKLALQGFVASVQPVTINGQTWHRVRLGPFRSASELETTKQKLAAAGIRAIALKESD